jgi:hypothetical protein
MSIMQPLPLSPHANRLAEQLKDATPHHHADGPTYHVAGLGSSFYFAYEQLRNVTEYREHHLLLRSAIERYLRRYVRLEQPGSAAGELLAELTQAGYLKNDSVPLSVVDKTNELLASFSDVYGSLRAKHVDHSTAAEWLHQIASVQIENFISPDPKGNVFMQFAYEHYFYAIDRKATLSEPASDHHYRIALFCAVQRAIFKSDLATTRYYCVSISLPELARQSADHIIDLNGLIDQLYQAPLTNQLYRLITRYGAPIRILREFIIEYPSAGQELTNRSEALSHLKEICTREYSRAKKSLNARTIRTIIFVLITKTLIGVAVEIPYDLLISETISWVPLLVNIAFPPLYMAFISSRIATPSRQNTEVIASYIDRILYEGAGTPVLYKPKRRIASSSLYQIFNIVYAIGFIGTMALFVWILKSLGFNIVSGAIFFLFFSAVSFLGFRLRQSAHELAMLDEREGLVQTLADFLSTPFVRIGHWLSDKYAKANIITGLLDIAIEMPIKTTLRMIRQWVSFMRDKQDEL